MRYFNGGTTGAGGLSTDSSNNSEIEETDQDDDKISNKSKENVSNDVSTASSNRLKRSVSTGDSFTKPDIHHQHQTLPPPPLSISWSPPPPISFRTEQQQQHRVTHGPGGEYK